MSQSIDEFKVCTKCKQSFPATTEYFYKHQGHLHPRCKTCLNQQAKQWQEENPDKVMGYKRKYAASHRSETNEKHREQWHNDPEFRAIHYQRGLDWKRRHPGYKRTSLKYQAATALTNAIHLGKMPPAKQFSCVECGEPAQQYHHRNGYEPEHWLDVVPLCTKCHGKTWRKTS